MSKVKTKKTTKKIDAGKIFVRIMAGVLAIFMVLGLFTTLIYYFINM